MRKRRPEAAGYGARKDRERRRQAAQARSGADVGVIAACANVKRRAKAERSLRVFAETYFAERFALKWAPHHLAELEHIERVIRDGGKQMIGDPRGDGKTTRLECAVCFAVLLGIHQYAALLTAVGRHAPKRISSLKVALLTNDLLAADYPEVCVPIRKMGGVANRATAMHVGGDLLWPAAESVWSKTRIVLPTVAGSKCSGSVIESAGLLEATRGLNHATADGRIIRPSIALVDDCQTNRSARSVHQCEEREEAISSGILHLCGPGKKMAALGSVTVIQPDDMADRLLDRDIHPEWHGIRNKMLVTWPTRMDLWDEYADVYRDELATGSSTFPRSKRFYRKHRRALDGGASVSWPERKDGASTAIENAMRKFIENRRSFFSEMQNEPEADTSDDVVELMSAAAIAQKVSGFERWKVPATAERLTWFVDVHKELLYYAVAAWAPGFTGWVVDYGTWPQQKATYFDMAHCRQKISGDKRITATTVEGRVAQAIDHLLAELSGRTWKRQDGAQIELDLGLIDAGWATDEVFAIVTQARKKHGLKVMPSFGQAFGAGKRPISRWESFKGVRGDEWHIPPPGRGRGIRHVLFDAGRRKTFLHRRLNTAAGDAGSLYLFHAPPSRHRLIAEHSTAEKGTIVSGPYGELVTWTLLPGRDNHWLDCLSGVCTAESILGGKVADTVSAAVAASQKGRKKRGKVKYL